MKKNSQTPPTIHRKNKKLALQLSIATALMTGYGVRPVWAGTCVGAGGTYNCTGPASATDVTQQLAASDLTVTTQAGFGIDTSSTGNEAFSLYAPSGSGNLIFTDTHQSTITGQNTAIRASNYNDGYLSILTNGTLTSNTDYGISVYQATSASHVTITAQGNITAQDGGISVDNYGASYTHITTSGVISSTNNPGIRVNAGEYASHVTIDAQNNLSGNGGVHVLNYGSGFTHITSGVVDGGADVGIFARNDVTASDISITTNNTVTAQDEGISANAYGYGGIQIIANGAVTSANRNAIDALNQGIGAVNVTTRGVITSGGIGINAYGESGTTGISVDVEADIQSNETGVLAVNVGILNTQVTATNASIVSGAEEGIKAIGYQHTRALTVETVNGGSVSGYDNGIYTRNYGDNATTINTTGTVSGTNGVGIAAFNEQTATDLVVTSQSTVSGSHFGVNAQNEGVGSTLLNLAGLVSSSAAFSSAVNVRTETSTTYANVQTAAVSAQHNGIRLYHYGSGSSQVTTYGDILASNGTGLSSINGLNSGSLNITTSAAINSEFEGILARNYSNAATQVILNNSTITSNDSNAIDVVSYIGNSDVSIHSYGPASISGHDSGIRAMNYDGGSLLVSTQGPVYGMTGTGINTRTDTMAQNHTIETSGSVQGQNRGIEAFHYGTGNLMVTTQNTVTSSSEEAIRLFNSGNGSSQLVSQGLITSYGGSGVSSYHADYATDLAVNVQGGVHAQLDGIEISNNGTGFSEITISGGTVTSITGNGVNAYQGSNGGVLTIVSGSAISGQTYGIYASTQANNGTNITVSASVNGQT